ncbi:MAG: glycerate 2-kinase [Halobacteriales archaeon]|jgi:glycerate 2-kinase
MVDIENRDPLAGSIARELGLDCVAAGIEAVLPDRVIRESVSVAEGELRIADETYDLDAQDEILIVGGGKPAARMASALESVLAGASLPLSGVVVTDDPTETDRIDVVEAAHPVPDERGVAGAERVLEAVREADAGTLVVAVIGGGGSALLPAPAGDLSLAGLQTVTEALLDAGADIHELNAVRKHCSAIKGGRLARAAAPATVVSVVLSDVVGDDLSVIASGPTAPDESTFGDAVAVLDRYGIDAPVAVRERLERGAGADAGDAGAPTETPGPDDPVFDRGSIHVLANGRTAIDAALETARERGFEPVVLSSRLRGEAREVGTTLAAVAEEVRDAGDPVGPPAVVISGGEATVTVRGEGAGGPNQELALGAALACEADDWALAAVDTDGRDGATDAAGALVDEGTVPDAETADAARDALADNDAFPFFDDRDALIRTGRTGTNVNDLHVLVLP